MHAPFWPPPQALLFDLDGTLIDSAPDLAGAANAMRECRGLPGLDFSHYRPLAGAGARGMLGVAFGIGPDDARFAALREEFLDTYERRMTQSTALFDGVAALLDTLAQRGLPWGIVTNKVERLARPLTHALPPLARAAVLICGDSTPHLKPHPAPLLEAARRLGLPPAACIYVGDDRRDIDAGRAAGMATVAAAYGYLGAAADPSAWNADALIDQPAALLKKLALA